MQIIDRNRIKVINTSFGLVPCMKAKTVIYGAYFALKLWFYRKIKAKKSSPETEISM